MIHDFPSDRRVRGLTKEAQRVIQGDEGTLTSYVERGDPPCQRRDRRVSL